MFMIHILHMACTALLKTNLSKLYKKVAMMCIRHIIREEITEPLCVIIVRSGKCRASRHYNRCKWSEIIQFGFISYIINRGKILYIEHIL